jgi:hypothetical protein
MITGTTRGSDRSVRTLRAPTGVTVAAAATTVDWGTKATLSGQVLGSGVGGTGVAIQRTDFPFTRGPWTPGTFTAKSDGRFTVTVGPLWEATRLQLVTRTSNVALSPVVSVAVRVRVGVRRVAAGRRAVVLAGAIRPQVPQATVSVQRLTAAGAWIPVARTTVTGIPGNRSHYRVRTPRGLRTAQLRVVVVPNDGGAHVTGASRALLVAGR